MATAEQLKSLIRTHLSDDRERFYSLALQVAAHEARQGHGQLAQDIRQIVDGARKSHSNALLRFPVEMAGMVHSAEGDTPLSALVVPDAPMASIRRIITEYRQQAKLRSHGLRNRRKILLTGPSGTGKTMTARVLANELRLPLHTIQVDRLVTKFMGETSAKLRQIFDRIGESLGVYLFDEFDALGGDRMLDNDVGEMRRVLNSLLQFMEHDDSDSMVVAATNSPQLLDPALFRRFDDVLTYDLPDPASARRLMENVLGSFRGRVSWKMTLEACHGMSHAEIDSACCDAIKSAILSDASKVSSALLVSTLREKRDKYPTR